MRKLIVLLLALMIGQGLSAQPKKLGIGVVLGSPTGFSVKHWNTSTYALQGAIGGGLNGITVGVDFTFHTDAFKNRNLPFYYGPGVFFGSAGFGGPRYNRGELALGARFIFGIDYLFPDHPFDIAFELGPALLLTPVVGMGIEAGLAFRFYP